MTFDPHTGQIYCNKSLPTKDDLDSRGTCFGPGVWHVVSMTNYPTFACTEHGPWWLRRGHELRPIQEYIDECAANTVEGHLKRWAEQR